MDPVLKSITTEQLISWSRVGMDEDKVRQWYQRNTKFRPQTVESFIRWMKRQISKMERGEESSAQLLIAPAIQKNLPPKGQLSYNNYVSALYKSQEPFVRDPDEEDLPDIPRLLTTTEMYGPLKGKNIIRESDFKK